MQTGSRACVDAREPIPCDKSVKFPVYYQWNNVSDGIDDNRRGQGQMSKRRILLVEDEEDIADLVVLHLGDLCDEVIVAHDGHEGMRLATGQDWALIILDLRLPGPDGLEICRTVRRDRSYQPILMLTSKSSELDRVLGLETGADDYLTKPFSVLELAARVRAIFRRIESMRSNAAAHANTEIVSGALRIDPSRREVLMGVRQIELTAREFDLLNCFARNPGRVFRRADLLDRVWGYGHEGYEHTVNSHINRLRAKIEANPSKPKLIVTVWGVGYKFSAQSEANDLAAAS